MDDRAEVQRLIQTTETSSNVRVAVHYTPTAIKLELSDTLDDPCCHLTLQLLW